MGNYKVKYYLNKDKTIAKFSFASKLIIDKSIVYNSIDDASNSKLVQKMFYLPFVKSVKLNSDSIELEKFDILKWEDVIEEVAIEIQNFLKDGGIILNNENLTEKSPISIYAESTPNPNVIKFVANKKLVDDIYEYKDISQFKKKSPVAYALYKKFDIKEVFISENYISITKNEKLIWEDSVMEIREFIRSFLENNNLIVNPKNKNYTDKKSKASEDNKSLDDVSKKIISIIEEYVKPAVASDGGNILFESYKKEDKSVNVILQGACSGCPSSTFTLKNGIENMLKEMLPGKILKVNAVNG
tara:strand:+ start:23411 stop:24313 length:903 start_codon:yes stop_codon:yes gene_type:complete